MKRELFAMAALGAALVFGCGGAPSDEPVPTDIGTAQQEISNCQSMGFPVTIEKSDNPRHSVVPAPNKKGLGCYDKSLPNRGYDCAMPAWYTHPNDNIYWTTVAESLGMVKNCSSSKFGQVVFNNEPDISAAFAAWKAVTGVNFVRTPDASLADYFIFCDNISAQSTSITDPSAMFAGTVNTDKYTVNSRAFNRWSSGPFGAITPPSETSSEPNNIVWYHHAITVLDDITITATLRDTCHISAGTRMDNAQRSAMRYIMTHEIGHALGFPDTLSGHGVMSATADLCAVVGDGSTVKPVPAISSVYGRATAELINSANSNIVAYPDTSACSGLETAVQHLGRGTTGTQASDNEEAGKARIISSGLVSELGAVISSAAAPATKPTVWAPAFPPPANFDNSQTAHLFKYTDNISHGTQTGAGHLPCNFTSTGQVCALPSGNTMHWCFDENIGETNRQNLTMPTDDVAFALRMGWSAPAPLAYSTFGLGGIKYVYHASCLDPEVELVIDDHACSGSTATNMDGYVCVDFPGVTAANTFTLFNGTVNGFPGTRYSWGDSGGYAVLHIDMADVATQPDTNLHRWQVMAHAILLGLDWVTGIGSRTDRTDLYSSRAVLPLVKLNTVPAATTGPYAGLKGGIFTTGEYCRSFYYTSGSGGPGELHTYPVPNDYCGPD